MTTQQNNIDSIDLTWIVVSDFDKALKFYTDVVGLKVQEKHDQYGWAELSGHRGGGRLGIAKASSEEVVQAGANGVITLTVKDINIAKKAMASKGAHFIGDILEIPGHVKLQTFSDADGNTCQLVQNLMSK